MASKSTSISISDDSKEKEARMEAAAHQLNDHITMFMKSIFYRRGIAETYSLTHFLPSDFDSRFIVSVTIRFFWTGTREDWSKKDMVNVVLSIEMPKWTGVGFTSLLWQLFPLAPDLLTFKHYFDTIKSFFHILLNQYLLPVSENLMLRIYNPLLVSLETYATTFNESLSTLLVSKYQPPFLLDKSGLLLPFAFPKKTTPCYSFIVEYSLFISGKHNPYTAQIDIFFYKTSNGALALCINDPTMILREIYKRDYIVNPYSPILFEETYRDRYRIKIPMMQIKDSGFEPIKGSFAEFLQFEGLLFYKEKFEIRDLKPPEYYLILRPYQTELPTTFALEKLDLESGSTTFPLRIGEKSIAETIIINVRPTESFGFEELRYKHQIEMGMSPDNLPAVVTRFSRKDKMPLDKQDLQFFETYPKTDCKCYEPILGKYEANIAYSYKMGEIDANLALFYRTYKERFAEWNYLAYLISKLDSDKHVDVHSRGIWVGESVEGYYTYYNKTNYHYRDIVQFRYIFGEPFVEFYVNGWMREILGSAPLVKVSRFELKYWNWMPTIFKKILKLISKRTDWKYIEISGKKWLDFTGSVTYISDSASLIEYRIGSPAPEGFAGIVTNILIQFDWTKYYINHVLLRLDDGGAISYAPRGDNFFLNASIASELLDFPLRKAAKEEKEPPAVGTPSEATIEEDWFFPIPALSIVALLDADGSKMSFPLTDEIEEIAEGKVTPLLADLDGRKIVEILGNVDNTEIKIAHIDPAATRKARKYIYLKQGTEIELLLDADTTKRVKIMSWDRIFDEGKLLFSSFPDPFDLSIG